MRVMGFDFGTNNIGIAVGNCTLGTTTALTILKAKHGQPNWDEVNKLLNEWQPVRLIVGYPLQLDNTATHATQPALKFSRRLAHFSQLKVELFDEKLSTYTARRLNHVNGQKLDDYAASVMLQSWINNYNNDNRVGVK